MVNKKIFLIFIIALAAVFPKNASAANNIIPGQLITEPPTLHSLGFEWAVSGDDNRNAAVNVRYKQTSSSTWQQAQPLFRNKGEVVSPVNATLTYTTPNIFAGSVLNLTPATSYTIEFNLVDPDGGNVVQSTTTTTKAQLIEKANRTLHVYPTSFTGTKLSPSFTDIQLAYAQTQPGETLLIHPGTYQKDLIFNKQATATNPITIKGTSRDEVTLQGQGNILIDLNNASYHIIRDLGLTDADTLIQGDGGIPAQFIDIRDNKFTNTSLAVRCLSFNCKGLTITNNVMTGLYTPSNWATRNRQGNAAVWLRGQGHDVGYNTVSLFWDGISINGGKPDISAPLNAAIDFYHNELYFINDDCMELDYSVHNIRVFKNFCHDSFMGISAQPIYGGPAYIFQNVVYNIGRNALKLNVEPSGLIIVNNTFVNSNGFISPLWSNSQILNNLFLGVDTPTNDTGRALFTGTYTPSLTKLDYNGYRRNKIIPIQVGSEYIWMANPSDTPQELHFSSLQNFTQKTGFEIHGVELDYSVFQGVTPPDSSNHTNTGQSQNFALKANSAAIDKGTALANITDGFVGAAPDLGAYELGQTQSGSPSPSPSAKPGDANADNKVDGVDYIIWLNHFNQNIAGVSNGNFNNDSKVDGLDYVIWLNNFGK